MIDKCFYCGELLIIESESFFNLYCGNKACSYSLSLKITKNNISCWEIYLNKIIMGAYIRDLKGYSYYNSNIINQYIECPKSQEEIDKMIKLFLYT